MVAAFYEIQVEQGEDFSRVFTYRDSSGALVNLTACTARMRVRERGGDGSYILELNTNDGSMVLGDALGTITLSIPSIATARTRAPFRGVYDIEIVSSSGIVSKPIKGVFRVLPEVTR